MSSKAHSTSHRARQPIGFSTPSDGPGSSLAGEVFLDGLRSALLVWAGCLFVALVGVLDYRTGSRYSFSLFYLIPVAACAWWGGFSCGILVSLAGALAWQAVDSRHGLSLSPTPVVWNGVVRFCVLTLVSSLVSRLHVGIRREQLLARTDPLTGAANGRTFYSSAAIEAERARRGSRPLSLAYFDLDNFKQLNDRQGHAAGDEALRHIVQTVRSNLRRYDLLARLGGDEFALLLPDTDAQGAMAVLARLHELVSREMVRQGWPVTLSIGAITFLRPPLDVDLLIQQVDALMYQAKKKGKGRVEHQVLESLQGHREESGRFVARRATALVLGDRAARVRPEGQDRAREEFAIVRDLSTAEIRLHLEKCFSVDTLLLIEPLLPGAMALLARVAHAGPDEGGWQHDCELSARLSPDELRSWVGDSVEVKV